MGTGTQSNQDAEIEGEDSEWKMEMDMQHYRIADPSLDRIGFTGFISNAERRGTRLGTSY